MKIAEMCLIWLIGLRSSSAGMGSKQTKQPDNTSPVISHDAFSAGKSSWDLTFSS